MEKINNGIILSGGHEYADTPRMRALVERADTIREKLPALAEGYVRLWRGNREGEIGSNPSFTNSLEGIALPFLEMYGGHLSYIDISEADLDAYKQTVGAAPDSEFILPSELAGEAVAVESV